MPQPARITAQLQGADLSLAEAGPLRDDISTDEITPVAILSHYDDALGRYPYTGFRADGQSPIGVNAIRDGGFSVVVAGQRYGKGSSREHSPAAEKLAGIRLVIAASFERIYRQNADNIGLFTSTDFGLIERIQRGEAIAVDIARHALPSASAGAQPPAEAGSHLAGAGMFVRADWRFIHEYYTGMCAHMLHTTFGRPLALHEPASIIVFEDHISYVASSPAQLRGGLVPNVRAAGKRADFEHYHAVLAWGLQARTAAGAS